MKNYKFLLGMFSILLAFSFTLVGCGSDDSTPEGPILTKVSEGAIQGLALPVKGDAPALASAISGTGFKATKLVWNRVVDATETPLATTDKFAADVVYKAALTLAPKEDYTFTGVDVTSLFTVIGGTITQPEKVENDGTVLVKVSFPESLTRVTHKVIKGMVAPVKATAAVVDTAILDNDTGAPQFSCLELKWIGKNADGEEELSSGANFAVSTTYTAIITLEAADGYTFYGVPDNFFPKGTGFDSVTTTSSIKTVPSADGKTATVTATFPKTASN